MTLTIGLDLGTTGCKVVALDDTDTILGLASSTYPLISAEPGQAEQDPQQVWGAVQEALSHLARQLPQAEIRALSFSGAMHSLLPIGSDNRPLGPALTWADTRPGSVLKSLGMNPLGAYKRTGCPLQAPYHPAKLVWLRQQRPEVYEQAKCFVSIKDYVAYQLTGEWFTDRGLASTTGLFNLQEMRWDADILSLLDLEPSLLPPIQEATQVAGTLLPQVAQQTGLPAGLPIRAGSSDGGAANLGAGIEPGEAIITVGTSGALRQRVEAPKLDPKARTWCYVLAGSQYFAGGAINNAGLLLEWLREHFYSEYSRQEGFGRLFSDAENIAPGAEGLTLLPYLSGERSPLWRSDLTATIHGLGLRHTRAHIARAGLEGIAFCLAELWDILCPELRRVKLTGGLATSALWAQILADVLGAEVAPTEAVEASAVGAAILARGSLKPYAASGSIVVPNPENTAVYGEARRQFKRLFQQIWAVSP